MNIQKALDISINNILNTVEPVYDGPVLSGHPLLRGQFSKSRFFAPTNAVIVTCIRGLKSRSQVTGQVTGHRPQVRSQVRSQVTHKNNRTLDKTVLDRHFVIQK